MVTGKGLPRISILIAGGRNDPSTRHTVTSVGAGDYEGEIQILTGPAGRPGLSAGEVNEHTAEASGSLLMVLPAGATLDGRCLRRLAARLQADPHVVAVAPLWRGPDGRPLDSNAVLPADPPVRPLVASGERTAFESPFGVELDVFGSMLMRTRRFFQVGGFDPALADSPYLYADLARRMTHTDGRLEIETGAVAFAPRRPGGFHRLPGYPLTPAPGGDHPPPDRAQTRRALWVAPHVPDRSRSGIDARQSEMLATLIRQGFDVVGWVEHDGGALRHPTDPVRWITPPADARWSPAAAAAPGRWLRQLLAGSQWDLVVIAEPRLASWVIPLVHTISHGTRVVVDLGAVRFPDAHVSGSRVEAAGEDLAALSPADGVIAATGHDAAIVASIGPDVPTTVFAAHGPPLPTDTVPSPGGGVLFVGDLLHRPNVDAVDWWVDTLAGRVAAGLGRAEPLRVVGSGSDAHRSWRGHPDKVQVGGWVPDLSGEFARARLLVVPTRIATGTGGRMATSLARGVPVVATTAAASVLPAALASLAAVGSDAAALAGHIVRLLTSDADWNEARARIDAADLPSLRRARDEEFGDWLGDLPPVRTTAAASPTLRTRRGHRRQTRAS